MNSKQRVETILKGDKPDRPAHFDIFSDKTKEIWHKEGIASDISVEEFFDLDIFLFGFDFFDYKKNDLPAVDIRNFENGGYNFSFKSNFYKRITDKNKYICVSVPGPFQLAACHFGGYESLLCLCSDNMRCLEKNFQDNTEYILNMLKLADSEGFKFDGVWIWEDIAYDNGLFFSYRNYNDILFFYHKKLFEGIKRIGKKIFFHSDGNLNCILKNISDLKVDAVHPLERKFHDFSLVSNLYPELTFIGNIDYASFMEGKVSLKLFEGKKYIYSCDSPIMDNIKAEDYKKLIDNILKRLKNEHKSR